LAAKRRAGFTLVELMMVVMIISVLLYMLLPAIQAARERVRRAQCASNLMQLGTAMSCYASTHSCLPPGVVNDSGPIKNLPSGYHHSWVVQILPFIGENNTYNHFDHVKSVYDAANDTVAGVKINILNCPSDNRSSAFWNNYAGCHHDADEPINSDNRGLLYLNSHVRYDEITDGPSYTFLVGEFLNQSATLGWVSGTRSTLRNTGLLLNERDSDLAVTRLPYAAGAERRPREGMFEEIVAAADNGSWPIELTGAFSSYHAQACNFLFADGSVRAVHNSVDTRVYLRLGNRADGDPISSDSY
jgi:prepilin-type N-terminal cleavage/methylation domain-containing protein/prepilin-type processing-associated H-X9-DG protein